VISVPSATIAIPCCDADTQADLFLHLSPPEDAVLVGTIEIHYPALKLISAFSPSVADVLSFTHALHRLHRTLSGEATLREPQGSHLLFAVADARRGLIALSGALYPLKHPGFNVNFATLYIDQSHLPSLLQNLQCLIEPE
jgi:hypothetical protein